MCAVAKVFLPIPDRIVDAADLWYRMVANAFIPAVLVAVSIVAIDFELVISLLADPIYMISTVAVVLVATLAAGFIGWLVKPLFHRVGDLGRPGAGGLRVERRPRGPRRVEPP